MAERIKSPGDLKALAEKAKGEIDLRAGGKEIRITIHMGTCGIAAGARDVLSEFVAEIGKQQVNTVSLRQSGCAGLCDQEPMVTLTDKNGKDYRYGKLNKSKVREIVEGHVVGGNPVARYLVNV
jgi:(2Fe-2S) ferredoxin